jgi:hypothetical protein
MLLSFVVGYRWGYIHIPLDRNIFLRMKPEVDKEQALEQPLQTSLQ